MKKIHCYLWKADIRLFNRLRVFCAMHNRTFVDVINEAVEKYLDS